jgi:hypothetical protein
MPYVEERDLTASVRTGAPLSPIAAPGLPEWPHAPHGRQASVARESTPLVSDVKSLGRGGAPARSRPVPENPAGALGKRRTMTGWAR